MKLLNHKAHQEIKNWIHMNARILELALWQYHFEAGSKEAVISALEFYQNIDGGFGHALEPDCWNPNSSPYTTLFAINILNGIKFCDMNHPIYKGIMEYLNSGVHFDENGWLFNIPTNNDYPHAPWWTYNKEENKVEGIGVTTELAAFVLRYFDKNTDLYKKILVIVNSLLSKLIDDNNHGDMGIGGYLVLIETLKELGVENFDYSVIQKRLNQLVKSSIQYDVSKWEFYGVRPSNYMISPNSIYYKDNLEIVQTELDYLMETRLENNVWEITWTWFENNDRYAKEFAISENWWKAYKAIEKMILIKNFGRFEKA